MAKTETEQVMQLDPSKVDASSSAVRYSVLSTRIDALKASILAQGRINDPVEVTPVLDAKGKATTGRYQIIVGDGRLAAVLALNKEGAGLKLPAIVRSYADVKGVLARQLSENVDRQSLSPMDIATAIKNLLEAGYSKPEIRALFSRPGGKNGKTLAPASNAWLNMMVSFLDLPKDIRERVHDGRIGVAAAYTLTTIDPEKRSEVLEKIEAKRLKELEAEEKEEARLTAAAEKDSKKSEGSAAKQAKAKAAEEALDAAEKANIESNKAVADARAAMLEAGKVSAAEMALMKPEEKKALAESIASAKAAFTSALKTSNTNQKALSTAQNKLKAIAEKTEKSPKAAGKAKAAAPKAKAKPAPISPKDVKAAAKEVGTKAPAQVLTMADMRRAVATLEGSKFKTARAIGKAILDCFNGVQSIGSMVTAVEVLTGERKVAKA